MRFRPPQCRRIRLRNPPPRCRRCSNHIRPHVDSCNKRSMPTQNKLDIPTALLSSLVCVVGLGISTTGVARLVTLVVGVSNVAPLIFISISFACITATWVLCMRLYFRQRSVRAKSPIFESACLGLLFSTSTLLVSDISDSLRGISVGFSYDDVLVIMLAALVSIGIGVYMNYRGLI